jgi:hypothetical protein
MSNSQFYNSATSSFGYSSLGSYNPMSKSRQNDLGASYPGVQIIPTYDAPGYDSLQHGNNQYEGGHFNYGKAYGNPNGQGCQTQRYVRRPCGPCKQVSQQLTQEPPYNFRQENSINDIPSQYGNRVYMEQTMAPRGMSPYGMDPTMSPYGMDPTMSPYGMDPTMSPYGMEPTMSPYGMNSTMMPTTSPY